VAVNGWRAAAAQGLAQAQYALGIMFYEGRGVAQSDVEATRWYRKAADQGHAQAQYAPYIRRGEGPKRTKKTC
jgi:hypothetical protein